MKLSVLVCAQNGQAGLVARLRQLVVLDAVVVADGGATRVRRGAGR